MSLLLSCIVYCPECISLSYAVFLHCWPNCPSCLGHLITYCFGSLGNLASNEAIQSDITLSCNLCFQLSDLHKQSVQQALIDNPSALTASAAQPYMSTTGQCPVLRRLGGQDAPDAHLYTAPQSPPQTPPGEDPVNYSAPLPAAFPPSHPVVVKVPRRVQLLNFWASTRVVQRLIMVSIFTMRRRQFVVIMKLREEDIPFFHALGFCSARRILRAC